MTNAPPQSLRVQDVSSGEALSGVGVALRQAAEIAVDVEADAMHAFEPRLCFVQLAAGPDIFLVDTLAVPDVAPLREALADAQRPKYFHAAGGDLAYLAEAGLRVAGLFDTHRAVTLLGWPRVGLADLVAEICGVALKKEHQQSDFAVRPLPPEQRDYIADDVRYLVPVAHAVRDACVKADILDELLLDCRRMTDEALARPPTGADYAPKFNRQRRPPSDVRVAECVLAEVHQLRLGWARAANVPFGRVLSNRAMTSLAERLPEDEGVLLRLEGMRRPFVREHGQVVLDVVAKYRALEKAGALPEGAPRPGREAKREKRLELLKRFRTDEAQRRKVTPSVVLPTPLMGELAGLEKPSLEALSALPYLGPKRLSLYGEMLVALLESAR